MKLGTSLILTNIQFKFVMDALEFRWKCRKSSIVS